MKCPYTDIGCWYINDETHECEAESMGYKRNVVCRHEPTIRPENNRETKQDKENEE
jgi:hypothetical protein